VVTDVSTDQQQKGLETYLEVDRDAAARFGISPRQINNTLYDASASVRYRSSTARSINTTW
jgi:multidrug efflux pump